MPVVQRSSQHPARQSIRSEMIKRVRRMEGNSFNAVYTAEEPIPQLIHDLKINSAQSSQFAADGKFQGDKRQQSVENRKVRRNRTGPNGKRAVVSDDAIESMAAKMEKRTNLAIRLIGRSIGF